MYGVCWIVLNAHYKRRKKIYNMVTHVTFVLADINLCILIYLFNMFICGFIAIFYFHVIFSLIVRVAIVETS